MSSEPDLTALQAHRRAKTDARLREALGSFVGDPSAVPAVAALARGAGTGRNIKPETL